MTRSATQLADTDVRPAPGHMRPLRSPVDWRRSGVPLAAACGLLVGLRRAEAPYADGDVLWGARGGNDFLNTLTVPRVDVYSWTAAGKSWTPNSWAWNIVLGAANRLAGLAGIALLGVFGCAAIAYVIGVATRARGASVPWTILLIQVIGGVFSLFLYARAQLVDYAAVLVLPLLVRTAVHAEAPAKLHRGLLLIGFVQVLWMNLHTAALLGPVLIAAAGLGHVAAANSDRRRVLSRIVIATVVASTGCLATPYVLAPITHANEVRKASVGLISEWRPAGIASPEQLLGVAAVLIALLACWFAVRARRLDTVAVLLVLAAASAAAIRFAPMAALFAVPELAAAASRLKIRARLMTSVCVLAAVILAVACVAGMRGFAHPGLRNASPLVTEIPHGCKLLNDLGIGGDVIYRRPDVLVSIDSRNDLYGRAAELGSIEELADPRQGMADLARDAITCVLAPSSAPLVETLRHTPGWRVLGSDGLRTLVVRSAP